MTALRIGELAARAGITAATIRYYERVGLLARAPRSASGYRRYDDTTLDELRFIRKAQALGFSLTEIGEILDMSRAGKPPCGHVLDLVRRRLTTVDLRIRELTSFRDTLAREIVRWSGVTESTAQGLCQIIAGAEEPPSVPGDVSPGPANGVGDGAGDVRRPARGPKRRTGVGAAAV